MWVSIQNLVKVFHQYVWTFSAHFNNTNHDVKFSYRFFFGKEVHCRLLAGFPMFKKTANVGGIEVTDMLWIPSKQREVTQQRESSFESLELPGTLLGVFRPCLPCVGRVNSHFPLLEVVQDRDASGNVSTELHLLQEVSGAKNMSEKSKGRVM